MRRVVAAVAVAGVLVSVAAGTADASPQATSAHVAARSTTAAHIAAPRSPLSYEAPPRGNRAVEIVQWRNPRSSALRRVVVRYARGVKAPAGPRRGHGVHLRSKRAHTAQLSRLARDTTYSVSIFAIDRAGRASKPAVTRFTTPAKSAPGARGVVRGTVTDTANHPLGNALVAAYDTDSGRSVRTATNTEGAFVLGLPTGTWAVGASGESATGGNSDATGYSYDFGTVDVTASRTVTRAFRLPAGGRVSGRVVDTAGHPVAGALPYLLQPFAYVSNGSAFISLLVDSDLRTNADGRFVLRGTPAGEAAVLCASGVAARVANRLTDFYSTCAKRSSAVAAGRTRTLPDLVLTKGAGTAVAGRLVGSNGRALAGVVSLESKNGDIFGFGFAAANGTFRVPGVAAGTYRACGNAAANAASRTGWTPSCTKRTFRVRSGVATHPVVRLSRGAAASGTVTGPGGRRLAGAFVTLAGEDEGGYAVTDRRGQWRVTGLPAGKYRACVNGSSVQTPTGAGATCWHGKKTVAVRAGRVRSGVDVRLPAAGGVTGVVRDTAGRPAAYASVTVGSPKATEDGDADAYTLTDAQGRYSAGGLRAGRYVVCATSADAYQDIDDTSAPSCTAPVGVRTGKVTRVANLVLAAPTAITVQVRDSSGLPVAGVNAAALSRCRGEFCSRTSLVPGTGVEVAGSTITDADGRATLPLAAAGSYAVCLYAYFGTTVSGGSPTGYADACHGTGFDVTVAARTTSVVTMTLQPGGTVSGRVTDTTGHAVADARIVVPGSAADDVPAYQDDEGPYPTASYGGGSFDASFPTPADGSRTGTDGRFTVIGVRPGTWTVCAFDDNYSVKAGDRSPRFGESCAGGPNSAGVAVTAGADTHADVEVTRRG